ncbi:hypothetical protein LSF60_23655 (plasmid) [Rhodococcus pyridinivorans]|uniref:hypothetical protein n=1 Tax=Rhodococcus pyridinivorans TaxID=103816 RepID=UPI001E355FE4|nr:hypothetical protein [Rhodococcus pyridinivorans]UGQ60479.1 hypothetical protein LSF60_23655 [Rhodococcus pyridinivorans]
MGETGLDAFGDGQVATAYDFDCGSDAAKDPTGSVEDVGADAGVLGEGFPSGGEAAAGGFVGIGGVRVRGGDELVRGEAVLTADLDAGVAARPGDDLAHPSGAGVPDGDGGVGAIGDVEVVTTATAAASGLGSGAAGASTVGTTRVDKS